MTNLSLTFLAGYEQKPVLKLHISGSKASEIPKKADADRNKRFQDLKTSLMTQRYLKELLILNKVMPQLKRNQFIPIYVNNW